MKRKFAQQIAGASIAYLAVILGFCILHSASITLAIYYGGIVAYVALTRNTAAARSLLRGWSPCLGLAAITVFAAAGPVMYLLWPLAVRPDVDVPAWFAARGLAGPGFWLFAASAAFFNPAMEETLWRGCLTDNPRRPSWIDAAFAGYHIFVMLPLVTLPFCILAFIILGAASWFLRCVQAQTAGLAACYLAHTAADLTIIAALYLRLATT